MKLSAYKKILGKIPAGIFVFDEKLRISYVNDAFFRAFCACLPSTSKKILKGAKVPLNEAIVCKSEMHGAKPACGSGVACAYCSFFKTMRRAVETGEESSDVASVTAERGNRTETVQTRIRVIPVDEKESGAKGVSARRAKNKGRLFLGIAEGAMQTEIAREMLTAKQMQQRLLPAGKQTGGIPYSYMYIPSLEIGGDLPDVYEYDGKVYGVLSDVSGKGISAGMLSAFIRAGFDRKTPSLAQAVTSLRNKFVELNPDERSYITVAAVRIDRESSTLFYLLAGHNAPILLKNQRGINEIEDPAPPVSNWIEGYVYAEKSMPYSAGDILVLLSDGVTECPNTAGERFGVERAESVLMQSANAEDFIGKLKNALTVFSGGKFNDDITAVAFDLR